MLSVEPMTNHFLVNFARDNDLQVVPGAIKSGA